MTRPSIPAWLAAAVFLAAAAGGAWLAYRRSVVAHSLPEGLVQLSGRIEGDAITVASKLPGRVRALAVREGDTVRPGELLATLDDGAARARLAQAVAGREVARARAAAARADLELLRRQLPIAVAGAAAALAASDAALEQARAGEAQSARERERARLLREAGTVDPQTGERAELAEAQAAQGLAAARAGRDRAASALRDARLGPDRVRAREAELAVLDAAVGQAQALVDEAQSALDDLTIVSPAAGTITTRFTDAGEVVGAGTPLLEIIDLDHLHLKAFVAETDIGKVRVGAPAQVYTDAFPDEPVPARVGTIAARAEFTPKEVQTRDERVKLVYAVKLEVSDNRDRRLAPGLAADAVVRWRGDAPWAAPRD